MLWEQNVGGSNPLAPTIVALLVSDGTLHTPDSD